MEIKNQFAAKEGEAMYLIGLEEHRMNYKLFLKNQIKSAVDKNNQNWPVGRVMSFIRTMPDFIAL